MIFGSRDKRVRALDPKTGNVLWTFPTRGRVDSSPVLVGDRVFLGSSDGHIYGLDRRTGNKVWDYEAGGSFAAGPAVAAGRLLIASEDGMLVLLRRQKQPRGRTSMIATPRSMAI